MSDSIQELEELKIKYSNLVTQNKKLQEEASPSRVQYPKVIYNKDNTCVTVQDSKEEATLKPYFKSPWNSLKELKEISYKEALELIDGVEDTVQEKAVKKEADKKELLKKEAEKLKAEKDSLTSEIIEKNRREIKESIGRLDKYDWAALRTLGKDIEFKLGVDLSLGSKRDIIEDKILEALKDTNDND